MQTSITAPTTSSIKKLFLIAWIFALIFYFIAYATRSAPSLMLADLEQIYSLNKENTILLVSSYYIAYSIFALVAGACLDAFGAKYTMFSGAFVLGIGCILFILSSEFTGYTGRLLQGAGSAFAFPGCVYLISKGLDAKHLATAIGFSQCVGMLGGAAGQFVVAPLLADGLSVTSFWIYSGILCIIPAVLMLMIIPKTSENIDGVKQKSSFIMPFKVVFTNKNSWLTGIISGLLFAPTTIFFMTWAIKFFESDLNVSHESAAFIAPMAAFGWVIGSPLMGFIADKIGKRKPVIILGCLGMILMLLQIIYIPNLLNIRISILIFGIFSGVAMIPYSVIKEANPDFVKGSATGVQNFLTFGVTSLVGPLFTKYSGSDLETTVNHLGHFKQAVWFWIIGISIALVLTLFVAETGKNAKK